MAVRKDQNSGKWLMDVWVGVHRIRRLLPDRKTAELLEKDLKVKEARGELLDIRPIKNITFEAFSKDYLEYVRTNLSEGRYQGVESVVRATLVPYFGPYDLREITPKVVEDFKVEQAQRTKSSSSEEEVRSIKASSINEYLSVLSAMFTLAVKWDNVRDSPVRQVKRLKMDTEEPSYLSAEESNRLLEACREDRDLYTFTALGLSTGMRVGEIINLTWPDVDLRRGVVRVRPKTGGQDLRTWRVKTGDIRDIPANDFLSDILKKHPRHITSPYVLHQRKDGRPFTDWTMQQRIGRAGKKAGLSHVHPHLLRHTFGTHLAANGVDVVAIQRLMGHTDITMTMRYLHAAPNRMKGAVETLPFGRPIAQNLDSRENEQGQGRL